MARTTDAYELALKALAYRERSIHELREWLEGRDCPEEEVRSALEELIACGQLDDERFAHRYAEDKRELSGWGADRIRTALLERGVAAQLAERAVASGGDHASEVGRAHELLVRRGEDLDCDGARARALGFLTRRGYDYEVAHEAIRVYESSDPGIGLRAA